MDIKKLEEIIVNFRDERDWKQFHSPKNLAISLSIEAAEILEHFQWQEKCKNKEELKYELADVLAYLLLLAKETDIDLEQAFLEKMKINNEKYPSEKVKGSSKKYTEYEN